MPAETVGRADTASACAFPERSDKSRAIHSDDRSDVIDLAPHTEKPEAGKPRGVPLRFHVDGRASPTAPTTLRREAREESGGVLWAGDVGGVAPRSVAVPVRDLG